MTVVHPSKTGGTGATSAWSPQTQHPLEIGCVDADIHVQPRVCHFCAQVCVEAGMLALRRDGLEVNHEDFNEGIVAVQAKKKAKLIYYA